jgi:hypothetical protein
VDIVEAIHPAASGIGVIVTDQIWVTFDREIDEISLSNGNIFVAGPDYDTWSGPDMQLWGDPPSSGAEADILESPALHGLLQASLSFQRLDVSTDALISGIDTVGSGLLYKTRVILTPNERLVPDTEYTVYLSGDEDSTDDTKTGILSRTVFDPVVGVGNTGNGSVTFIGPYIGLASSDTYHVTITTGGDNLSAWFSFYRDSDPTLIFGPFKARPAGVLLSDGVRAVFANGLYQSGDTWSVLVKEPDIFIGSISWPFKTGSGSIEIIPETLSTSVIATTTAGTAILASALSNFDVVRTSPLNLDTSLKPPLPTSTYPITVTFNQDIDAATVIPSGSVIVTIEPSAGISTDVTYPGEGAYGNLPFGCSVNKNILTITVASGIVSTNSLVDVLLTADLASSTGISLSDDYEFYFTTTYEPLYCSIRRLRLTAGQYMINIPDDALNLALHMASLEADERTWNKENVGDSFYHFVRSEWTCCRAAQIILANTIGGPGRPKAKKLGDLSVEYDTTYQNVQVPLDRIQQCLDKWEKELLAGGRQIQKPGYAVKGEYDIDRPTIGRSWLHTRDWLNTQTPAANMRVRPSISRRWRSVYGHRGWWER